MTLMMSTARLLSSMKSSGCASMLQGSFSFSKIGTSSSMDFQNAISQSSAISGPTLKWHRSGDGPRSKIELTVSHSSSTAISIALFQYLTAASRSSS